MPMIFCRLKASLPVSPQLLSTASDEYDYLPATLVAEAREGKSTSILRWLSDGNHVDTMTQDGMSLLHIAAANGHVELCRDLLRFGASWSTLNSSGDTPLIWLHDTPTRRSANSLLAIRSISIKACLMCTTAYLVHLLRKLHLRLVRESLKRTPRSTI